MSPSATVPGTASHGTASATPSQPSAQRSGTGPAPGPPANLDAGGPRSPVVVASIGTYSGPAGAVFLTVAQGAQVWAKWVTQHGGLNGHPVSLIIYDDGGDPARHRAQAQEAIERRHVLAFVANAEGLNTGQGSVEYITSKRVPVIGSEMGSPWFYDSPMYFPQGSTDEANFAGTVGTTAAVLKPQGKTKVATLTCVEADGCKSLGRVFPKYGPEFGLDVVYQAGVSLAQPDYTAECLNARNAGAQAIVLGVDISSVRRVVASCARQGYRPLFGTSSAVAAKELKDDPDLEGFFANSSVFPYFQTGTPATDEYQAAMRVFGQGVPPGLGPAGGWVAGKVLERAAARLSEPPTSEAILAGLWSFRGETLGGITQPLTFVEGRATVPVACWFGIVVHDRQWQSLDGFKLTCRDKPIARS